MRIVYIFICKNVCANKLLCEFLQGFRRVFRANATDGGTDAEPRLDVSWENALHFIEEAYRPEIVQVIVIKFVQPEEALTVTHRMRSLG